MGEGKIPQDRNALAAAIKSLPAEHQKLIELKFVKGATIEEVAVALGKSPGQTNAQFWRAMQALRRMLHPD